MNNQERRIMKDIASLRKIAKKHRDVFIKAKNKADKLELPFIVSNLKKKYEGRFYQFPNAVDNEKWTGYLYCIEVSDFFKASDGIVAKGKSLTFEDMKSRGISIRTQEQEFFSRELREISREKFKIETEKILLKVCQI